MNFIWNILTIVLGKVFGGIRRKLNNSSVESIKIATQSNTAVADARASILVICAICLAIYWIPQYLFADYMWIKLCLKHDAMMPFPIDVKKLFDMIYSLLGLGAAGIIHGIARKFINV